MECAYCLEQLRPFMDVRKLPCEHIGCSTCLNNDLQAFGHLECPTCRTKFEVADANLLEKVTLGTENQPGNIADLCGVCEEKKADVFCVTCQKALCKDHLEEDEDKAEANGLPAHYHVKIRLFMKNPEMYRKHYCRVHQDKLTSQACVRCAQVFCPTCDPQQECPVTGEQHDLRSLAESVQLVKIQMKNLQAALAAAIARFQVLEKDLARKTEFVHKEKEKLIADVDRTVREQVESITLEGERLKAKISMLTQDFDEAVKYFGLQLMASSELARSQMSDLERIAKQGLDGLLLEKFSDVKNEIIDMINSEYQPVWMCPMRLVTTGEYRSLEIELGAVEVCSVEYTSSVEIGLGKYYSVRWISEDLLVAGTEGGIEIRDSALNLIRSTELNAVYDVVPYSDQLIVLQWHPSDDTMSIKLCSQNFEDLKDLVELPTKTADLSQISAADGKIFVTDPVVKNVLVWSVDGELLQTIDLSDMARPGGVCVTADGDLLVSDWSVNGYIKKYLGVDYSLVWTSDVLEWPWGITEGETGLIYVSRSIDANQAVYQVSSDGRLLQEITCDQLENSLCTDGMSIAGDLLAVACREEGLKLFTLKHPQYIDSADANCD